MIHCHKKFENLEEELSQLQDVLKNSLQKEVLTIKELDKESQKFKTVASKFPELLNAHYVIFSTFMSKEFHDSESFIFVNVSGANVTTLCGRDLDLYEMIKECEKLKAAQEKE